MGTADAKTVYEALVRRHAGDLYRFAYRLVGNAAAAEDLMQETYFHGWRSIGSLRDLDAGRAWLLTILRRRWARSVRADLRRPRVAEADLDETASPLPGPDLELFARREALQGALDRLDPRMRETFLLVFLEGLSCREAAERLSAPLGTVLSRLHRARAALRVLLREPVDEGRSGAGESRALPGGAT